MKRKPQKISMEIQIFVFTIGSMLIAFAAFDFAIWLNLHDLLYFFIIMVFICFMLIAGGIWLIRYNNDQAAVFFKQEGLLYLARYIDQTPALKTESNLIMDALKTRLELDGSKNFIKKMENITDIDDFANDITIQLYQLHEIQNIIELKHSYQLKCITFRIKYKRGNRILQKAKKMTFQIGKYYTNMDDLMRELEYMHSIFIAKGI